METKKKTLNELINNNPYSNGWATPEAYALYIGELYASEENRKKDEPKQSLWEEARRAFIYSRNFPNINELQFKEIFESHYQIDPKQSDSPEASILMLENFARQSQQPVSIQWLSEDEIDRICELRFSADEDDRMFKLGIEVAQTELRKRVIDPVEFTEWFINNRYTFDSQLGKFFSESYINSGCLKSELLQIYINSKTK